jgi:Na+-transporting NADH:ubiquinone oxidoreductase subunit NqrC
VTDWAAASTLTTDPSAVLGSIIVVLVGVIGLVLRSIVKGNLVPKAQVDQLLSDRDNQILALAATVSAGETVNQALSASVRTLSDSVEDFSEATKMQLRLAEALRTNLHGGDELVVQPQKREP